MYYIISLKHTSRQNNWICLWRPNNSGYTCYQEYAGVYDDYERGYHDTEGDSMPILKSELDGLFIDAEGTKGNMHKCIPNCRMIWEILDLRMTKYQLVKRKTKNK